MERFLEGDTDFWNAYSNALIDRRDWQVYSFDHVCVEDAFKDDAVLYAADASQKRDFEQPRSVAAFLRRDPESWSQVVLKASQEVATRAPGPATELLEKGRLLTAFEDFVVHTHYFRVVQRRMAGKGYPVTVLGQRGSCIHDIDKLDPIMLAGYCERWEDLKDTSLWRACVLSHYTTNMHHQQNSIWHHCPGTLADLPSSATSDDVCVKAMPELLCDKVSRKLQKELHGRVCDQMWHLERDYYIGLPEQWFLYAERLAKTLTTAVSPLTYS